MQYGGSESKQTALCCRVEGAWLCWALLSFAERLQYLASVNFKLKVDCELLTLLTGLMFFQHDIMIINRI